MGRAPGNRCLYSERRQVISYQNCRYAALQFTAILVAYKSRVTVALCEETMSIFEFKCSSCGDIHSGVPTFGAHYPITMLQVPEQERDERVSLGTDDCVIDGEEFYVRGCIEIPVHEHADPFVWGSWVSLSEASFHEFIEYYDKNERDHVGPFFGWHCGDFMPYETTCVNLKTRVHLRNDGIRPYIELEPTDHPMSIEQRNGISRDRLIEIYETILHGGE